MSYKQTTIYERMEANRRVKYTYSEQEVIYHLEVLPLHRKSAIFKPTKPIPK